MRWDDGSCHVVGWSWRAWFGRWALASEERISWGDGAIDDNFHDLCLTFHELTIHDFTQEKEFVVFKFLTICV